MKQGKHKGRCGSRARIPARKFRYKDKPLLQKNRRVRAHAQTYRYTPTCVRAHTDTQMHVRAHRYTHRYTPQLQRKRRSNLLTSLWCGWHRPTHGRREQR